MFVIAFAPGLRPRRFRQEAEFYLLPSLPVAILRHIEMFLFSPLIAVWLIWRQDIRVIVAQSPFEGAIGALAKNMARLFGRKITLIVENHGDFEAVLFQQRRVRFAGLYRHLMNASARYAFRHADLLRAISAQTEQQLVRWSPGKPIARFMTWTDAEVFARTARVTPLAESWNILYAGVLTPLKGVHFLLQAFARFAERYPQAQVWLVGKAENADYARELRMQVAQAGLSERVHFVGPVPQGELARHMASARVLVLASTTEGLGRVLVEAMLCGTPAIGSRVGGIPDVIEQGVNGYLIAPGDVEALTGCLVNIFEDKGLEAMGTRAKAFAQRFFSPEDYLAGYRRLFEAALRG